MGNLVKLILMVKLTEVLSRQLLLVVAVADLYLLIIMSLTRTQVRMKLI